MDFIDPNTMPMPQLFYREKGNGHPLILLHGLWGASDNWLPIAGLLAHRFHVYLPDLRNHGQSPHHPDMEYNAMSEDIRNFIEQLNLNEKPYLIGHSMGGKVLMTLLLQHPNISAGNAIIDIAPVSAPITPEHQQIIDFMVNADLSSRKALTNAIRQHFSEERTQQLLLKNLRFHRNNATWKINVPAIYSHLQQIAGWETNKRTYNREILFIKGENSPYITNEEQLKTTFPAARMITIPHAGHWLHTEQPETLSAAIADYFK